MKKAYMRFYLVFCLILFSFVTLHADKLPSWNEGPAKAKILQFIRETTDKNSPYYIPPAERIATFDQDGTLWTEQPFYFQLFFIVDQIKNVARDNPYMYCEAPFNMILKNDFSFMKTVTEDELEQIMSVSMADLSVDDYHKAVRNWLARAVHPRFKRPFTDLVYKPMLEVLQLFRENGFKTYIVSGGGQEFIRAFAEKVYAIPPEQVIGTTGKVKYEYNNGNPYLKKLPSILFVNDKSGKPEGINLVIGRRPVAAFGNSLGDKEMLEWTQAGKGKRLELLVHHDDDKREYAYGERSLIGTFPKDLMDEALDNDWIVVSMKKDWKVIYPWE